MINKRYVKGQEEIITIESVFEEHFYFDDYCSGTIKLGKGVDGSIYFALTLDFEEKNAHSAHPCFTAILGAEIFHLNWCSYSFSDNCSKFETNIFSGEANMHIEKQMLCAESFLNKLRAAVLNEELIHFVFYHTKGNGPFTPQILYIDDGINEEWKEVFNTNIVKL